MKERVRVTTDPEYYEEHSESLELWSSANSLFAASEFMAPTEEIAVGKTLK